MQRTEKRVIRQQICHSLLHIFESISPQTVMDIQNAEVLEEDHLSGITINDENDNMVYTKPFIRQCPKDSDQEFWTLYYNIFNIVEQWSHKKTCTIFCYELIIKMMCCGNLPFYLHVLKYQPKSKSGYILPSLHRNNSNKPNNIPSMMSHHANNSNLELKNKKLDLSALPDNPSKSPIIKFLISNLANDNYKRDTLRIILQFIQELPEEFVVADNEWYASLIEYLQDKIILYSNPNQLQELNIIAAIFTAFAERDGKSYFVPAIQKLMVDNKGWWNRIGLETLHHAVVVFGHSLSRYNFTLGACLSPLSYFYSNLPIITLALRDFCYFLFCFLFFCFHFAFYSFLSLHPKSQRIEVNCSYFQITFLLLFQNGNSVHLQIPTLIWSQTSFSLKF